jgi:hypothetical protein
MMIDLYAKHLSQLIKWFGPPKTVKEQFYKTLLGGLLGQSVILGAQLLVYAVIAAMLTSIARITDIGLFWFCVILTVPLACIFAFSALPTALRARREQRLKVLIIKGIPKPGYWRLQPYGANDYGRFKRLDGADAEVLNWLKTTKSSLLYLSGASGVGKSSLLSASALPKLREAGWDVVETRIFGNAIARLLSALLTAEGIFDKKPQKSTGLQKLLSDAARSRTAAKPLLIVIDQFEEFLILHDNITRGPFVALLNELAQSHLDGLRFLLVFRSNYRPLIFKLDLPVPEVGKNWYELAPYARHEATTLLRGGGRELSAPTLDELFRGLDRIEEARGLYRPITLNMAGIVLAPMGETLSGDPAKLIQTYLTDSLTAGESRDFAKSVLTEMITDAGTKEPHPESELARRTQLEPWQVKATLTDLALRGLVRRLEEREVWEVAHDFLARLLGQLIGRLKPTPMDRVRPLVAPSVLLGCVVGGLMSPWDSYGSRR